MKEDHFEVGGEELLVSVYPETPESAVEDKKLEESLEDIRIRIGTLLKTDTVSLLLGAGASVDCGGPLISSVPLRIERELIDRGIKGAQQPRVRRWLKMFYLAAQYTGEGNSTPVTRQDILARRKEVKREKAERLGVNFERILAMLHSWRSVLPKVGSRLQVDGTPKVNTTREVLDECINHATHALSQACHLPTSDKKASLANYETLIRKVLTRPLNLKRVNIFTLNYDTLVEQAADAAGVFLLDGFGGTQQRIFRPECYEQDLYFPAETTEGRVHRFDRVLHLYKLHGSITWLASEPTLDNPYGVRSVGFDFAETQRLLIYPTPAKYGETLGLPYSELFRRFANALVRPQSVLVVIGYGFGDEHVNAIIRQALVVPSFTLVIVDPNPKSEFVNKLRKERDRRIWIASGPSVGTFAGFVDQILPDLRDEEIRKKVLATQRALRKTNSVQEGSINDD